jgi:lysophospholipase L1-like esterase
MIRPPYSVACYGTSLTTGRLSTSWTNRLERNLQAVAGRPIRVYDVGAGSTNSQWGVENVFRVTQHKPTACLLEGFSINDSVVGGPTELSLSQARANKILIKDALLAANPAMRIFVLTMNGVTNASLRPNLEDYYQDDRDFAAAYGLTLLDVRAAWGTPNLTDTPDGLHPTQEAVDRVLLPAVTAALSPLVL